VQVLQLGWRSAARYGSAQEWLAAARRLVSLQSYSPWKQSQQGK